MSGTATCQRRSPDLSECRPQEYMKSTAAIWVDALTRFKKSDYRPKRSIRLVLTCGEETLGAFNSLQWLVQNRPEWVAALWGCLIEGVVAVPIDYRSSADLVRRINRVVQAKALLVELAA